MSPLFLSDSTSPQRLSHHQNAHLPFFRIKIDRNKKEDVRHHHHRYYHPLNPLLYYFNLPRPAPFPKEKPTTSTPFLLPSKSPNHKHRKHNLLELQHHHHNNPITPFSLPLLSLPHHPILSHAQPPHPTIPSPLPFSPPLPLSPLPPPLLTSQQTTPISPSRL